MAAPLLLNIKASDTVSNVRNIIFIVPATHVATLRLSVSSSIERNTLLGSGVKVRSLHDLSTNELLDGLKSLGCPLKARRCLLTVGINGKDFEVRSVLTCL